MRRKGVLCGVIDGTGKVLDTTVVYPTYGERQKREAIAKLTALCTLDDDNAVRAHAKGCGILDGKMESVGIQAHIHNIDEVLDDLTEGQGNDS